MDLQKLLNEMTLEEKIGQCVQLSGEYFGMNGEITGPLEGYELSDEQIFSAGSVLGVTGAASVRKLQTAYLEKSRLKIPLMFMADIVHGYETIFPIPLAMSSSFDPKLIQKTAEVTAKESYAAGCHVTFAPMVDVARDARWGRVLEGNGEDYRLSSLFAKAYVEGFQSTGIANKDTLIACVKHFAAYGAVESGREYNTVDMSERVLREFYLPPYKAALDAGAMMVMTSFNTINSIPATVNKWLMRDVLRGEYNFKNVVISDWGAVKEPIAHGVCKDLDDAGIKAMIAGCDIEMSSPCYFVGLKKAVETGVLAEAIIDEATLRILQMKKDLGLFENPFRGCDEEREKAIILSEEHQQVALEAALNSIVLLQNNHNVLPLMKKTKLAIVGPNAMERELNGGWSWRGHADNNLLLCEVLKAEFEILYVGERFFTDQVKHADYIIYAGGEKQDMSGEAHSRSDITLPFNQAQELEELAKLNLPIIFINYSGRPIAMTDMYQNVEAIVQAWFLGTMTNQAVGQVLTGAYNPSGKLTISFPRNVGQCPIFYNVNNTGRPYSPENVEYVSKYIDVENDPLFVFGHGLNYGNVEITNISQPEIVNEQISFEVTCMNKSERPTTEVLQVYFRDLVADVVRPVQELIKFEKITVEPNEQITSKFVIEYSELAYVNLNNEYQIDAGEIKFMVGFASNMTTEFLIEI